MVNMIKNLSNRTCSSGLLVKLHGEGFVQCRNVDIPSLSKLLWIKIFRLGVKSLNGSESKCKKKVEERCFKSAQCMQYIYFYHQHKLLESFFRKNPKLYQNADILCYMVVLLENISIIWNWVAFLYICIILNRIIFLQHAWLYKGYGNPFTF